MAPRLSILIPNFDNGRASSRDGARDFLRDLLESLAATLTADPTPLEIILADDGSSDDSLETARSWARRPWAAGPRAGRPFLRLIELEHSGVLSAVANRLVAEAEGDICCRLDGDIVVHTRSWADILVRTFESGPPDLGVVGGRQLGVDGRIHSAGSWLLHPRGHHHVGQGAERSLIARAFEIDHVMGCFYAHRRAIWEEIGGYDTGILRGQTEDFSLRARLAGWRVWSIPTIEFTHLHAERTPRRTEADWDSGIDDALLAFERKWGFDRLAPDLDEVARRYAGTSLLWNPRFFGPAAPWPPPSSGPVNIRNTEWSAFAADERRRDAINARLRFAISVAQAAMSGRRPRFLHVQSRAGLLAHLLATQGHACTGVDHDARLVELAQGIATSESYPQADPVYVHQADPRRLPVGDASADVVLLFDVLEYHPNPVGLLREAHRALAPDGAVAIVTRRRQTLSDADADVVHAYLPHELDGQVRATRLFDSMVIDPVPWPSETIALAARARATPPRRAQEALVDAVSTGRSSTPDRTRAAVP
jgi:glycosyltransferase involved in cell wall biosynthesis/2-polyprenyl-3-methyl-5-hydroxy-6-metoxy-1,4-benzoquinol methylase